MKKKIIISRLFLYRYRFIIGYIFLSLAFIATIVFLLFLTTNGLTEAEMKSATTSYSLNFSSILNGNIIDLPYRILQKFSIAIFGLTIFSVKLPSILIGLFLGFLLILLLNRWFKNNVALFASIITVFSAPFLFLAGFGTPLIMLVLWPTLLLWLGSKIQGKKHPKPIYSLIFAFILLLSLFTPHLIYLVGFIILFAFFNPHLRFTIKKLPKIPLITTMIIVISGITFFTISCISHPEIAKNLIWTSDFSLDHFIGNINTAFAPFFTWNGSVESVFLSPLIGLGVLSLAIVGLISTTKGFFASRNAIASCFIVFSIILSGLNPESAILIILPLAILTAHGLRYILEKWYTLFPENPYARIFAILPISLFLGIIIVSDISHFVFGYRYTPGVANQFNNDLSLIYENLNENDTLVVTTDTEYNFYNILNKTSNIKVTDQIPINKPFATLGKIDNAENSGNLHHIITSPKSDNSARIYIYEAKN